MHWVIKVSYRKRNAAGEKRFFGIRVLGVMAAVCLLLWPLGQNAAMLACLLVTIVLRLCAAHFRWSLPRLREGDQA